MYYIVVFFKNKLVGKLWPSAPYWLPNSQSEALFTFLWLADFVVVYVYHKEWHHSTEKLIHSSLHKDLQTTIALCSRNFQNVKLRLDIVEMWSFYRHSDFTWNHILGNSNSPKMLMSTILEVFDFSKEQLSSSKFTKIQSSDFPKLPKMTFLDCLNSPKCDFT